MGIKVLACIRKIPFVLLDVAKALFPHLGSAKPLHVRLDFLLGVQVPYDRRNISLDAVFHHGAVRFSVINLKQNVHLKALWCHLR